MSSDSNAICVRERLIQAGIQLFTTRGYTATSVREIVEAAGVTKPALYYYFTNKEGLYLSIFKDIEKTLVETLEAFRSESGSARERLEKLFVGIYDRFEANLEAARFLNSAFWSPAPDAPKFDCEELHNRIVASVQELVEVGIAKGEFRGEDPVELSFAFVGVLSFSMDLTLATPQWSRGKPGLLRALDFLFSGVLARDSQETVR